MTTSPNRSAFDAAIDAWNGGDLDRYLELYDDRISLHGYSPEPMGKAEVAGFYQGLFMVLGDVHLDVLRVVESDDTLAVHAVMSGTHVGELFGVPATGTRINQSVMTMLRFSDAKVVERWSVADMLGVMAQLGAVLV
jgi:steroid delta-isomerase-like uncharacterized protein